MRSQTISPSRSGRLAVQQREARCRRTPILPIMARTSACQRVDAPRIGGTAEIQKVFMARRPGIGRQVCEEAGRLA